MHILGIQEAATRSDRLKPVLSATRRFSRLSQTTERMPDKGVLRSPYRVAPSETGDAVGASQMTVMLAKPALSRLAWLCDARVHDLQKCIKEKEVGPDEVSAAENDITYFKGLAAQLRSAARDG